MILKKKNNHIYYLCLIPLQFDITLLIYVCSNVVTLVFLQFLDIEQNVNQKIKWSKIYINRHLNSQQLFSHLKTFLVISMLMFYVLIFFFKAG